MSSDDSENRAPPRGRPFPRGNPGRKPGSKNKMTLLGEGMLSDHAAKMTAKGIELAEAGNERMLKFFLDRILPKRVVEVELPQIDFASDAVDAFWAILRAVGAGQISPSDGLALSSIVESCARVISIADLEIRLAVIEKKLEDD